MTDKKPTDKPVKKSLLSEGDDNILLFTREVIGAEFSFYIRNIYVLTARSMNTSILKYLQMYAENKVPDPPPIATDENLVRLYDVFDWSILEILEEINPDLADEKPVDKLLQARTAIVHVVQRMFADYKITRKT